MTTTVLVADDQVLLRAGLSGIVDTAPDLRVVGQAADGRQAVELTHRLRPDVVLMDVRMPVMDGLEATRLVVAGTASKVLVLTTFDLDEYVFAAVELGASGFLLKDTPPEQLLDGIRTVAAGDALLGPGITRRLVDEFVRRRADARPPPVESQAVVDRVTPRELEVLRLVAAGRSNAEIAEELHVGAGTAKTHVGHLLAKLGARDRVQLVVLAHRCGVAPAPKP